MGYLQIKDIEFIRGKVPMTKSEVRTLSVIKLKIEDHDLVWDIGAGTGSISIEAALNYPQAQFYAIERNSEGIELIKKNSEKFSLENIWPISGLAPDVFKDLPLPNKVIIGGSGGNLEEILIWLWSQDSLKTIVVNAVTLNTAYKAISFFYRQMADFESIQAGITNIEMIKEHQMLKAENPIFIITANKMEVVK